MGKTKELSKTKPLVLDYVDPETAINEYLCTVLPHIEKSTIKINKVYKSGDGKVSRFRVNWYINKSSGNSIFGTRNIVQSKYVEIAIKNGKFVFEDLTFFNTV